jgi:hypothetical protein
MAVDDPNVSNIPSTDAANANATAINSLDTAYKAANLSAAQQAIVSKAVADGLSKISMVAKEASSTFSIFNVVQELANQGFDLLKTKSEAAGAGIDLLAAALIGPSKLLSQIAVDKSMSSLSESIKQVAADTRGIFGPLGSVASALGIAFDFRAVSKAGPALEELKQKVINLGANMEQHINLERAVFNMATQTGQLNEMFSRTGYTLSGLSNLATTYSEKLLKVAVATGSDNAEVGKYFDVMSKFPPIYGENIDAATAVANQMERLSKTMTLARGSGQSVTEGLSQQKTLMDTFNVSAERSNDITVEGSQLTEKFGVNIATTTGFLTEMASSFKFLGDNTQGATAIMNEFFGGLRDGGLGIGPAMETIKQMTESLSHLNIAQKAFLSARTGGPGGLLGGIEIERDLAAGKSKEVLDKLRDSFLKATGGKVITREDVHTQQEAAEFTKQRAMLQSGAFGGIAKSDEQAAAILKAFSRPGGVDLKTANDALADVMKKGQDYQKLSYTKVDHIAQTLDGMAVRGGVKAADIVQGALTFGGASEKERGKLGAISNTAERDVKSIVNPRLDRSTVTSLEGRTDLANDMGDIPNTLGDLKNKLEEKFAPNRGATNSQTANDAMAQARKEEAFFKNALKSGDSGMSKETAMKELHAVQMREQELARSRGNQVGTAAHQAANIPATQGAASTRAQATAHPPGATTTVPDNNIVVNVYVDGKHIPSRASNAQSDSLGPVR